MLTSSPTIPEVVFERIKSDITELAFNFFQDGVSLDVAAKQYKIRLKASGIQALEKTPATNAAGRVTFVLSNADKTPLNGSEYQISLVEVITGGERTIVTGTLRWSVPSGKTIGLVVAPDVSVNYIAATGSLMVALGVVDFGSSSSALSAAAAAQSATLAENEAGVAEDHADAAISAKDAAVSAKDTAVSQAGIATTKAGEASTSKVAAGISEGNAKISETNAKTSENIALAYKIAAQSSADAALIQSGLYATEALGRAAVSDGQAFKVQGSGDIAAYEYRRTNSTTSTLVASYPSSEILNGAKIFDSGSIPSIYIPEQQFIHSRGETELIGNAIFGGAFATYGYYEQMSTAVIFNKARLYVAVPNIKTITVRAYKSATLQSNPSNMILLAQVIMTPGTFNGSDNASQVIDFGVFCRAKQGEYVYIFINCPTAGTADMRLKVWNTNTTGPVRHGFLTSTDTVNPWTTGYGTSNATNLQTSFELICTNQTTNGKLISDKNVRFSVAPTGKLGGVYIDPIPVNPSRGDAEIIGNGNFSGATYFGFGQYEQATEALIFNRIDISISVLSAHAVTMKIYTSKIAPGVYFNTSGGTLMFTKEFASGEFNAVDGTIMKIDLGTNIHVDEGAYYYILFYSSDGNVMRSRRFTVDAGSAPFRHAYMALTTSATSDTANPWATAWTFTSPGSGFYAPSHRLYNIQSNPDTISRFVAAENRITANETTLTTQTGQITTLLNNSLLKAANGSIKGVWLPVVQYVHERGEPEMLGNASYSASDAYAFGFAQLMSTPVAFDKVEFPIMALLGTGVITARIYKQTGAGVAPSAMTLLYTVDISAADFNKSATAFQVINLPSPVIADAGNTIHVYFYTTAASNLQIKFWNVDATAPVRTRFLRRTTASDPWGSTPWTVSTSAFYAATFRLSLGGAVAATTEIPNPRLVIPSKIYAVVGSELSIYDDAIILGMDMGLAQNPVFMVNYSCRRVVSGVTETLGARRSRCWRVTPVTANLGTNWLMEITITDRKRQVLYTKTVSVIVVDRINPSTAKLYHQNGDSITADGNSRIAIAQQMATLTGGVAPASTGSLTSSGAASPWNRHEGHGGWKYFDFVTDGMAATQAPGNPYWNAAANGGLGALDITNYRTVKLGLTAPFDLVSFQCGVNDMRAASGYFTDAQVQASIDRIKTLITAFLADSSGAKIIVQLPTTMRNTPISATQECFMANMWRLREMIINNFDNFAYNPQVYVGQVGLCVDRYYGYQYTSGVVASRYTETENIFTDDVHMRSLGYQQMGDALFPQFIALLQ